MLFMNEYDINDAMRRYTPGTVRGDAVRFLAAFRDQVDEHSDGWAYWRAPVQAATKLMQLIQAHETATPEAFAKALTPIRAFYTRRGYAAGMKMPVVTP